jgi:3-phosphoshikimate 1-carboxyvinyltransferase
LPKGPALANLTSMRIDVGYTEHLEGTLDPPSSKNYTTRYLLAAALADGDSIVRRPARSDDADALVRCLVDLGAVIREETDDANGDRCLHVTGFGRRPKQPGTLNPGNAGAVARFLMGTAALLPEVRFETDHADSLGQRPHGELLDALEQLGATTESRQGGCFPLTIRGGQLHGGLVRISGARSSQYLTSILFLAPLIGEDVEIEVIDSLVSKPLITTTLEVLESAGIEVAAAADLMHFKIAAGQSYRPGEYRVNGDYPSAAALLSAAVITRSEVTVRRLYEDSQGERAVIDVLQRMGAQLSYDGSQVVVNGHAGLRGIEFNGDMATDMVLVMLPLAAMAEGESRFYGIGNLRIKECDRIAVPVRELGRLGVDCEEGEDEIIVRGRPSGYEGGIELGTHNDHRVAQMLTIMGLQCRKGIVLNDAETVAKSYPGFYQDLTRLGARIGERS